MIKSTAIDPSVVDADGVYRKVGPARVFLTEPAAIDAIKAGQIQAGDILVLMCRGPMGSGMEETYQVTSALKHLAFGKHVAVLTDARFSGVSTGACIGHISPEALAGVRSAKLRDGDMIEIIVDRNPMEATVNLVGENGTAVDVAHGEQILASRDLRPDLAPDRNLPADTRLWAALQDVSGGTWGGAVYDVELHSERPGGGPESVRSMMKHFSEEDVRQLLPMRQAVRCMREAFLAYGRGEAQNQPRRRLRLPNGSTLHSLAGAYGRYFGTKVYSSNPKHELVHVSAIRRGHRASPGSV